ncbi:hypothetical protein Q5741_13630 [Paenibacillus sp. JX-17]|uniref:Glycosyltransferase RgtA/B/C/D-like domain-containing protein n=1 Tax=Paenibacillus lacisoli TaxID=3064525 RepID=A0ABT9CDX7_9BACL|nr:hypothetical protein [Paenibacillus sp. JX-17]MDO7907447.1 hypothetical protein [Paenibacillus sp. JX-17]
MRRTGLAEVLAVIAGMVILVYILFTKPFVGVADNGDFLRVMGSIGLNYYPADEPASDRFFTYAHSHFNYDYFFRGFYVSTQIILVAVARLVGYVLNSSLFDIRVLGAIFGLLLLAATFILVRYNQYRSRIVGFLLAVLLLFVFFDIGYVAYFNSLFGEPVSMLFMLLSLGFGLWLVNEEKPSRKLLWMFFISVFFLSCAKIQNVPVGILFALIGLRLMSLHYDLKWRKTALWLSVSIFVISVVMYVAAPKDLKNINLYQTFFFGILNGSPDVKGDLEELGLPERLSVLAGTNYFEGGTAIKQDDPSLQADFYDRVSHKDVLFFYLKHPSRLIDKMEFAANNSMTIRPYYLGSYVKEEGKPAGALSFAYSTWSEFKKAHMPHSLLFIVLFYAVYYAVALVEYFRARANSTRIRIELLMVIGLVGIVGFMIPILGDGQADIGKHLFLFDVSFDMMAIVSVVWLVYRIVHLSIFRRRSYY